LIINLKFPKFFETVALDYKKLLSVDNNFVNSV